MSEVVERDDGWIWIRKAWKFVGDELCIFAAVGVGHRFLCYTLKASHSFIEPLLTSATLQRSGYRSARTSERNGDWILVDDDLSD